MRKYLCLVFVLVLYVAHNGYASNPGGEVAGPANPTLILILNLLPLLVMLGIGYCVVKMIKKNDKIGKFMTPSGAGLALLCFFLPWAEVSCVGQTKTISGADLGGQFWIVFVVAAIALCSFFYFNNIKALSKAKPIIIIASIIGLGFLGFKIYQFDQGIDTGFGKIKLSDIGFNPQFGSIGTLLGFLMAFVGSFGLSDSPSFVLKTVASTSSGEISLEKIKEAKQLLESGAISEDEYNKIKDKIIN